MVSLNRVPDVIWLHKMPGSVAKAVLVRWDSSSFAGGEADLRLKKKLGDSFSVVSRDGTWEKWDSSSSLVYGGMGAELLQAVL